MRGIVYKGRARRIVVLIVLLLSLSARSEDKKEDPVLAPLHCGWTVLHVNILQPLRMIGAWRLSAWVERLLVAKTVTDLRKALDRAPSSLPYERKASLELLASVDGLVFQRPIIKDFFPERTPSHGGYEDINPFSSPGAVKVFVGMILRGVKSWTRSLYRTRDSILYNLNSGYDVVQYKIEHHDESFSYVIAYQQTNRTWRPATIEELRPRTVFQQFIVSNGRGQPTSYFSLYNGHGTGESRATTEENGIAERVERLLKMVELNLAEGNIFSVEDTVEGIARRLDPSPQSSASASQ